MKPFITIYAFSVGIFFYTAIFHLLLGMKRRFDKENLSFSFLCFAVGITFLFSFWAHQSDNYSQALYYSHWNYLSAVLILISFPVFASYYTGFILKKFLVIISVLSTIIFLIFVCTAKEILYVNSISTANFPWDESITLIVSLNMFPGLLFWLLVFCMIGYCLYCGIKQYRLEVKKNAMFLILSMGLILCGLLVDLLIDLDILEIPFYSFQFFYLTLILLMSYAISEKFIESEEQYRNLIEKGNDGICIVQGGRIKFSNSRLKTMLGVNSDKLLNENFSKFLLKNKVDSVAGIYRTRIEGGVASTIYETVLLGKDGQCIDVEVNASHITFEGEPASFTFIRDITKRKEAENARKKLEEQFFHNQKIESLGQLAGGIAHDFNNILTGTMGYAEFLSMKFKDLNTDEGKAVEVILSGTERAAKLTQQLLRFARKGNFEQKPLNINTIINETLRVSEKIFDKQIIINCDYDEKISTINADKNQLDQVFTNIFINAKDAMPDGGELKIETENIFLNEDDVKILPNLATGKYVKISLKDSGMGMPKEVSDRIFEPFYTTKGEGKGTGLGLASVYGIIKSHNGNIYCESEPGEGTTFLIYFPASDEEVDQKNTNTKIVHGKSIILIADDEKDVLSLTKILLESLEYKVLTAKDGDEAIEIYKKKNRTIDLILLDLIMPGMTGKDTFYKLKKINQNARVLLSSGYGENKQATDLLNDGALGFIQKPFRIQELSTAVADALKL